MATLTRDVLERLNTPQDDKTKHSSQSDRNRTASKSESTGNPSVGTVSGRGLAGIMMMKKKMSNYKKSKGPGSAMGASSVRSGPKIAMENSYKLEPEPGERFDNDKVKTAINDSIKLFMAKQTGYNPTKGSQVPRYLSEDIKARLKKLNFKRYKFVVHVTLGQSKDQGFQLATRCIWDTSNDNEATVTYRHKDLFIVVTVFATYFE